MWICTNSESFDYNYSQAEWLIDRHNVNGSGKLDFLGFVTIFLKVKRNYIKDAALVFAFKEARKRLKMFEVS